MEEAIYEGRKLRKGRDGRMKGNKAGRKDETNEHKKKEGRMEGRRGRLKKGRKEGKRKGKFSNKTYNNSGYSQDFSLLVELLPRFSWIMTLHHLSKITHPLDRVNVLHRDGVFVVFGIRFPRANLRVREITNNKEGFKISKFVWQKIEFVNTY